MMFSKNAFKVFEQESQECQVNELQAGVEPAFAVFPQLPVLVQPSKAALHDSALGHHLEGVQLTAFDDLHRDVFAQDLAQTLHEGQAHIAAVAQHASPSLRPRLAMAKCLQHPLRSVTCDVVTAIACGNSILASPSTVGAATPAE